MQTEMMTNISYILKDEIFKQHITYEEFAKKLNISHSTLKRWLSLGHGLSFENLLFMLSALDLNLATLVSKLDATVYAPLKFSNKQEEAFVKMEGLLSFYENLQAGKSAQQIMADENLNYEQLSEILQALIELELIRLKSALQCEIVAKTPLKWRKNGPLDRKERSVILEKFIAKNKDAEALKVEFFQLTEDEVDQISFMQKEIIYFARKAENVARLTKLHRSEVSQYGILNFIGPHELKASESLANQVSKSAADHSST